MSQDVLRANVFTNVTVFCIIPCSSSSRNTFFCPFSENVYFGAATATMLRRYLRTREQFPCPWLWITRRGTRLNRDVLNYLVEKVGRAAGLPNLHPHALRHTWATQALRSGMGVVAVSRLLGHAHLRTTQRYVHLLESDLRAEYGAGVVAAVMG